MKQTLALLSLLLVLSPLSQGASTITSSTLLLHMGGVNAEPSYEYTGNSWNTLNHAGGLDVVAGMNQAFTVNKGDNAVDISGNVVTGISAKLTYHSGAGKLWNGATAGLTPPPATSLGGITLPCSEGTDTSHLRLFNQQGLYITLSGFIAGESYNLGIGGSAGNGGGASPVEFSSNNFQNALSSTATNSTTSASFTNDPTTGKVSFDAKSHNYDILWNNLVADSSGNITLLVNLTSNNGVNNVFVDYITVAGKMNIIPEPATASLGLLGLGALLLRRRRSA